MTTLGSTSTVFLTLSVVCCLLSNSWMMTWMSLEVNTMSFCAILLLLMSKETLHKESIMKYFMVQSLSSAILLMSSSYELDKSNFMVTWLVLAILVKMGSAPFHQWFINMSNSLPMKGAMLLMTSQKILPIFLLHLTKSFTVMVFVMLNMTVGTISQYYAKKFLIMMSLSSVANLSWLIASSQLCMSTMWTMMTIYMLNVMLVFMYLNKKESIETNKSSNDTVSMMMMMSSLAGMPPLMVFFPKWIITKEMILQSTTILVMYILTLSSVSLYIYMRMFTPTLIMSPTMKKNSTGSKINSMLFLSTLAFCTMMV